MTESEQKKFFADPGIQFTSPEKDHKSERFVRIGEEVIVQLNPEDYRVRHLDLLIKSAWLGLEGEDRSLLDRVVELKYTDPAQVDGGSYSVSIVDKLITLKGCSAGLVIPIIDKARNVSVEIFQRKSPGFKVVKE